MNNKTVFSQLDSRWSKLPYPNSTYTLGTSGCGCVSITHLLIETDKYSKYTPKDVQPYMKQFAVPGSGTSWAGITTALSHYGFKNIVDHPIKNHAVVNYSPFKALSKAKYKYGIMIFGKGTKGGVTWTLGGHVMAVLDYRYDKKTKRHYLYMKDSGGRRNTGWFCYETQMKGLVVKFWTAEPSSLLMSSKPTTYKIVFKARGGGGTMKTITAKVGEKITLPKNLFKRAGFKFVGWSVGKSNVVNMNHFQIGKVKYKNKATVKNLVGAGGVVELYACWKGCGPEAAALWLRKIAADNKFRYGKASGSWYHGRDRAHQLGCHFCGTTVNGPKKAKKGSAWDYTYCCNALVMASYVHGANMWSKCKKSSTNYAPWLKLTKGGKKVFKKVGTNVPISKLKAGDVLTNGKHAKMFVGVIKDKPREGHAAREGWDKKSVRVNVVKAKTTGKYTVVRMK